MSRLRSNCSVTLVLPSELEEVISVTPAMCAELALERGGDRGRHDVRAGAGQGGTHADGREIDLRERRDGQHRERDGAGDRDGDR